MPSVPGSATGDEGQHNIGRRSCSSCSVTFLSKRKRGGNVLVGHDGPALCVLIGVNGRMEGDGCASLTLAIVSHVCKKLG
jgi:hypothetical protein